MTKYIETHLISTEIVEAIEKLAEQESKEVIGLAKELVHEVLD